MDLPPPPPPPPPPPSGYGYQPVPNHPRATVAMVLGIVSLVCCGLLGPVALVMGRKAVAEIDGSGGMMGGRGQAQAGWICGLIATIFLVLGLVFFLFGAISGN